MNEIIQEQIEKIVLAQIEDGKRKFAIFPYGYWGREVQKILDERENISYILVDQKLTDEREEIYKLSILREELYSDYIVLLCSNNVFYYDELRNEVFKYVAKDKVLDVLCLQGRLFAPLQFGDPRIAALECASREIMDKRIEGNLAEAGVFRGNFAQFINVFFPDRKLYLIDTFEGFDDRDRSIDIINSFSDGKQDWSDTSVELVLAKMKYAGNCIVRKGYFPQIMEGIEDQYCFVSLDMDLYQPIYEGLQYFYPRLNHGGYIFVHDCRNSGYLGARKAVIDFCNEMKIGYVTLPDPYGTAVITK